MTDLSQVVSVLNSATDRLTEIRDSLYHNQEKTLRDEFAMAAIMKFEFNYKNHPPCIDEVARNAYYIADAMMKQREIKE